MIVVPGYEYVVTTTSSCTVTDDATGTELVTAYAGQQAVFQAIGERVTLSDPEAIVKVRRSPFESTPGGALSLAGGSVLPPGYTRLEFLLTGGPQYINTGLSLTPYTGCEIELAPVDYSTEWRVCCGSMAGFLPLTTMKSCLAYGYATDVSVGKSKYPLKDGGYALSATQAINSGQACTGQGRAKVALNYLNSRVWKYKDSVNQLDDSLTDTPVSDRPIYLFARNYSEYAWVYWPAPIYNATFSEGKSLTRRFVPALTPTGAPCMFDLVSRQPFLNSGSGQFVAGVKDIAQLCRVLKNLPPTGGKLTLSLPAEANTPEVAAELQACQDRTGWTLTVYEYRPAAVTTYSLRRVRNMVWCRVAEVADGNYVSVNGERFYIERCAAIYGPLGSDPTAYGYEPFDSVEQAAAEWGLQPYVYPEDAEPTID